MKIYLAGSFDRRSELKKIALGIVADGHSITARWLDSTNAHTGSSDDGVGGKDAQDFAVRNLIDIFGSDLVISLTHDANDPPRGGRHVEFGYALALRKKLIVCGPRENLFHHLPQVIVVGDVEGLVDVLRKM